MKPSPAAINAFEEWLSSADRRGDDVLSPTTLAENVLDMAVAYGARKYMGGWPNQGLDLPTEMVPVSLLRVNPKNGGKFKDPANIREIMDSGEIFDNADKPILLIEYHGKFYLDDGEHRCAAALFLGQVEVPAKVLRIADDQIEVMLVKAELVDKLQRTTSLKAQIETLIEGRPGWSLNDALFFLASGKPPQ